MIETKDILEWCFVLGALDFGVFGFLYSTYAAACFQATPEHPELPSITKFLKQFCRVVVLVLALLTALAAYTSYQAKTIWHVWVIVACFALLTAYSVRLFWKME
jgi:hypothetical protein